MKISDLHIHEYMHERVWKQEHRNLYPKCFFAERLHRRGSHQNSIQLVAVHIVSNFYWINQPFCYKLKSFFFDDFSSFQTS